MKKVPFVFIIFAVLSFQQAFSYFYNSFNCDPLVGEYNIVGKNGIEEDMYAPVYYGKAYIDRCGKNYQIEWNVNGKTYIGFGIKNGDCMAFSYVTPQMNNQLAIVIYKIDINGNLHGNWAIAGDHECKIERLEPCFLK